MSKKKALPYLFLLPAMLLVFMFYVIPIFTSLIISLTDMNLVGLANFSKIKFIGFENYITLFQDEDFKKAVFNTLFFVIVGVPTLIFISLSLALLINFDTSKFFTFLRGVFYIPSVTNIVAIAVVFMYLYNPVFGLLNNILKSLGMQPVSWLFGGPYISKISLIILAVWRASGTNMIIFLAAIKGISSEYYEAAQIDGATKLTQLMKITLPQLSYALAFVSITSVIGWVQFFDEPMIMTDGKPLNATLSIALFVYKNGFKFNKFGYSAAASLILFLGIMIVTIIQFRFQAAEKN